MSQIADDQVLWSVDSQKPQTLPDADYGVAEGRAMKQ